MESPVYFEQVGIFATFQSTYLFKTNETLNFANKIKTIDHINLILSGIHIHSRLHVAYM